MTGRYDLKITSDIFGHIAIHDINRDILEPGDKIKYRTFQTLISILQQYWSDDYRHFHKI